MVKSLEDNLSDIFEGYRSEPEKTIYAKNAQFSEDSYGRRVIANYSVVSPAEVTLRPLYKKGPPSPSDFGDHPNFKHLKGSDDVEYASTTTMFMDIENSTRLNLLYDLPKVRQFKNAFISTAIQIIRSFDGHVHRIMGDAVMAYFGDGRRCDEDGAIDGVNAASCLKFFAERVVAPKLRQEFSHDFGIRIGLDYGSKEDVLWSSYGFSGMEEVTATSFFVDVASKLQHAAGRNQVMLGDSLIKFLDVPEDLLMLKVTYRNGDKVEYPFLTPNLTYANGSSVNYRQRIFDVDKYIDCSPLRIFSRTVRQKHGASNPLQLDSHVYTEDKRNLLLDYAATGSCIAKNRAIRFVPNYKFTPSLPYSVRLHVTNHGAEAEAAGDLESDRKTRIVSTKEEHDRFEHWEHTLYRGLHYLHWEIDDLSSGKLSTIFGVYVS